MPGYLAALQFCIYIVQCLFLYQCLLQNIFKKNYLMKFNTDINAGERWEVEVDSEMARKQCGSRWERQ